MSPVNRAGSVSEISPRHSLLHKNVDWPGCGDLGFCDRHLGNRDEFFFYMNSPTMVTGTKLFFIYKIASISRHSGQNGIIFVLNVFSL